MLGIDPLIWCSELVNRTKFPLIDFIDLSLIPSFGFCLSKLTSPHSSLCPLTDHKNCEASEILLSLQANRLPRPSFMDVCRRQETPGSETRQFNTHSNSSSQRTSMCTSSRREMRRGLSDACTHNRLCYTNQAPVFGNLALLIFAPTGCILLKSKQTCSYSRRTHHLYLPRLPTWKSSPWPKLTQKI